MLIDISPLIDNSPQIFYHIYPYNNLRVYFWEAGELQICELL